MVSLVARESEEKPVEDRERLTFSELTAHYEKLKETYAVLFKQFSDWGVDAAPRLFGEPDKFILSKTIDDECLRQHFIGGIGTPERGLQPIALGVILERLLAKRNIHLHLGCAVTKASSMNENGYKLNYISKTTGEEKEFDAHYVINAAWDESPYLTYQASGDATIGIGMVSSSIANQPSTKVYLRSIGLFNVSKCTRIPTDRSYFGLVGKAGGMVSFFNPNVAMIYVPNDDLSYQGEYNLRFNRERETILDQHGQLRLNELSKGALQNEVLSNMLTDVQRKYPVFNRGNTAYFINSDNSFLGQSYLSASAY